MDDNDFDRQQDREEEREDDRFSAKLQLQEMACLKMQRCCAFLNDPEGCEVLHGRLLGTMLETDAFVIRDLRPGRELIQAKQIVPREHVRYLCCSVSLEKCQACYEYREMVEEAARECPKPANPPKAQSPKPKAAQPKKKEKAGENRAQKPAR